jgi:hypothetical protein
MSFSSKDLLYDEGDDSDYDDYDDDCDLSASMEL